MKQVVVSGAQVTGNLHLGNYLGAIKNWVELQNEYNCFFFLADSHAITIAQEKNDLFQSTLKSLAIYLAAGIDPKKSVIFNQSNVPAHSELAWILTCSTPLGWLKRMTQFKDKSSAIQDNTNLGLLAYPVLMAADILLYQANLVPVGDDQKQHLELTRDIAGIFNRKVSQEIFTIPEPLIKAASKIMNLKDPSKKMSKSTKVENSKIDLIDTPEIIIKKFGQATTDSINEITYDPIDRTAIANLLQIFSKCSGQKIETIVKLYNGCSFTKFKQYIAESVIEELSPIREQYLNLMNNQDYLLTILKTGADKANEVAKLTLQKVKHETGFITF